MNKVPMTYIDKLFQWAKTLEGWQQDAIKRIYSVEELTQSDENEILLLLKEHFGLHVEAHPKAVLLENVPKVIDYSRESRPLRLHAIKSLRNVNRVKDGSEINFCISGLTVVYGDNGSGKSGYGRVFKKACYARHAPDTILPNLYKKQTANDASAEFVLQEGENEKYSVSWNTKNEEQSAALRRIAIFDKACARIQTTKANDVSFLAYGQDIVERFIRLYERLSLRIQGEIDTLPTLPDTLREIDKDSVAAKWIDALSKDTKEESVDSFTKLNDIEVARYKELRSKVGERKLKDPTKRSEELTRKAKRTLALQSRLQTFNDLFSDDAIAKYKKLNELLKDARNAAKAASASTFSAEPLPNIGSETWKRMFLAAKVFAINEAYPDIEFRETFNKKCVLCLQTLQPDAKTRMERFDNFISDMTAKQLAEVTSNVEKTIAQLNILDTKSIEQGTELEADLTEWNKELLKGIQDVLSSVEEVKTKVIKGLSGQNWLEDIPACKTTSVANQLATRVKSLNELSEAALKEKPTENEKREEAELSALEHRVLLGKYSTAMKAFIEGKKREERLKKCKSVLGTATISKKQTELLNETVTEKLREALAVELNALGLRHIVPMFQPSSTKGKIAQSIILQGLAVPKGGSLQEILSEGEESVIAIAAFLAELKLAPQVSILVFDDPVSSLDHKWRDNVAKRLAQCSESRQIVIFTHDLAFVFSLIDWMKKLGYENQVQVQAIETRGDEAGQLVPEGGEPVEVLTMDKRIKRLNTRKQDARTLYNSEKESEAYRDYVKATYSLLRRAWERAVEEVLFGGVILRFRDSINTQQLKDVATSITSEDCRKITEGMDKCCSITDAHDIPVRGAIPDPDELRDDIDALSTFRKDIIERRKGAQTKPIEASEAAKSPA